MVLPRPAETYGDFDWKTENNFKTDILLETDISLDISVTVPTLIEDTPDCLANLSDKPVKLKKGYLVGELQPVDGFVALGDRSSRSTPEADPVRMGALCERAGPLISPEFCCGEGANILKVGTRMATSPTVGTQDSSGDDNLDNFNMTSFHEVLNYLSDLYERSCQILTSEQNKKMLAEVLTENCDALAKTKLDLELVS